MTAHSRRIVVFLLLLSAGAALGARPYARQLRDVDGTMRALFTPAGKANVLFFIASDCPISNGYAPEIKRMCDDYSKKSVSCVLVYEDVSIADDRVRAHRDEFHYAGLPAVIDRDRAVARRANATVTPQAIVVGAAGIVKYRGRIDNQYAALGKPRRVVTVHDLRDALDAVLAGRVVAHPQTEAFGCFIAPGAVVRGPGLQAWRKEIQ